MGPGSEAGATNACVKPVYSIGSTNRPTGKSLLFIGVHVKPLAEKYFCFTETKIGLYQHPSRPIQRGIAQGHQCGTGMRWTRMALPDQGA